MNAHTHNHTQVPVAELEGLGVELEKLSELESIKEEWMLQAEAQDEVGVGGGMLQLQPRACGRLNVCCVPGASAVMPRLSATVYLACRRHLC